MKVFSLFDDTPFQFRKLSTSSSFSGDKYIPFLPLKLNPSIYDMSDLVIGMRNPKKPRRKEEWKIGFPQGAPISPLLSIVPLAHLDSFVNRHRDRIRYADDFIEFPKGGTTRQ